MHFVKIKSIIPAGKEHVYDIAMSDHEDPSFVANNFIVHNSYASAESAYSTFLETTNAYRTHLTNSLFYKKLFPLIAISNGLFKDPSKKRKTDSLIDFLFNATNRQNLKTPVLHWHKDLTAKSEDNMMDMLEKVEAHGVPVPLKMWLASAGIDKDTLIRDAREDNEIKKELSKYIKMPQNTNGEEEDSSEFSKEDGELQPTQQQKADAAELTSASVNSGLGGFHKGILAREFSHEQFTRTVTGKKKHTIYNPQGKARDTNWMIAKIAARMEQDPNYKEEIRRQNLKKTGRDKLVGY
jgi:hypothetical protein